jgi:NADP-dependent aldehyde dehydrogenase
MNELLTTTTLLADVDQIARAAAEAFAQLARQSPALRARALVAGADALEDAADELVGIALRETGLTEVRLRGELKRTAVQLRLFADVVVHGGYLDVRIDVADPDFVLGLRPDLRRILVPLGPVLNFSGSNFPFAFSVAGGDTASALAAGCSVIVKAHSGHPLLSLRTAQIVSRAMEEAGAPPKALQVIFGQESAVGMLQHELIRAGSFTGSIHAGRLLADIAAARPRPIPFYGELGSVNPQFVTRAKLVSDADAVCSGYVASVGSSAGQLCTKPGFLFVHDVGITLEPIRTAANVPEHRMLNPKIAQGYRERRDAVRSHSGVDVILEGSLRFDGEGQGWVTPTIVATQVAVLETSGGRLLDESFGPLSIVVEYDNEAQLAPLARRLFPGNLTGGVHALNEESSPELRALIDELHSSSGRILFNGWPTGVAVTPAQQHGGPWPATTNDMGTSVGTAAIGRFLRGVAYQNMPQHLLPESLLDENPRRVPQTFSPAGESVWWGETANSASIA